MAGSGFKNTKYGLFKVNYLAETMRLAGRTDWALMLGYLLPIPAGPRPSQPLSNPCLPAASPANM